MRYSEFGKALTCRHCNEQTKGFLWDGKGPHFRAIYCEHCRRHVDWLKRRLPDEVENPFIENFEVFSLPGQHPKNQAGSTSQSLLDDQ